jgi:DNA (cytosine-5)-methyltransferase 1
MTRDGLLWELPMLAHHTRETESGLSEKIPTPNANEPGEKLEIWEKRAKRKKQLGINLHLKLSVWVQKFPTPTAHMSKETNAPSEHKRHTPTLTAQVNWLTPRTAGMCGGTGSWELLKKNTTIEEARQMGAGNGGKLNPMWVEWLMGWPVGWTDLKPLEMDKFQKWQDEHGRH